MQPTGRLELAMPDRRCRVLRACRTSPSTYSGARRCCLKIFFFCTKQWPFVTSYLLFRENTSAEPLVPCNQFRIAEDFVRGPKGANTSHSLFSAGAKSEAQSVRDSATYAHQFSTPATLSFHLLNPKSLTVTHQLRCLETYEIW